MEQVTLVPVAYNNHFVPQFYLKHFASVTGVVERYRILVAKDSVQPWKSSHVAGTAYQQNLYTRIVGGEESDDIEVWLNKEFEYPAVPALKRAVNDDRLSKDDYRVLSRFVAAQVVRTPAFLVKNLDRWRETAQREIIETPARIIRKLEDAKRTGVPLVQSQSTMAAEYFPMRVREVSSADPKMRTFRTEMVVGRAFWIYSMKHMLSSTLNRLAEHRWTILEAPPNLPWFTSDDPVLKLNYHNNQHYDFGGGWGSIGTEILLPISPRHMLYTKIGSKPPLRGSVIAAEKAIEIRRLIAQHAHRVIYSHSRDREIEQLRPRHIDESLFRHEQAEWSKWHKEQSEAEAELSCDL